MDQPSAPDLQAARRLILGQASALPAQANPLEKSLFRVPSHSLPALLPTPGFNHSTRDGFVLNASVDPRGQYRIAGEIAAGDSGKNHLTRSPFRG